MCLGQTSEIHSHRDTSAETRFDRQASPPRLLAGPHALVAVLHVLPRPPGFAEQPDEHLREFWTLFHLLNRLSLLDHLFRVETRNADGTSFVLAERGVSADHVGVVVWTECVTALIPTSCGCLSWAHRPGSWPSSSAYNARTSSP